MSIFASLAAPDDSEHEEGCAFYIETAPGSLDFRGHPCDCGQPDAPIIYQGSHVLPADSDPRGGIVDIALIPSHITRDGRDDQPEDQKPWPYLRFGVNEGDVILTVRHVEAIHKTLGEWLAEVGKATE